MKNRLIHGDCLEVMDQLIYEKIKIDAIITDPPYGINFKSNYRKEKYQHMKNDKNLNWLNVFVEKCFYITKKTQLIMFFVVFIL